MLKGGWDRARGRSPPWGLTQFVGHLWDTTSNHGCRFIFKIMSECQAT